MIVLQTFIATLDPLLMLFLCLLLGFILKKYNILPENAGTVLSRLETYLLVPAVSFATFTQYCTPASLSENAPIVLYACLAITLAVIIAICLSYAFRVKDDYKRNIYRYALTFGNYGFVGNAIVPMILGGDEFLYKYLLFTLPLSFVTYLWGITILTPKEHRRGSIFKQILNVPLVTLFIGAILGLTGIGQKLPAFAVNTVDSLKNCMGPIAMILCGFVIASYPFKSLLSNVRVYIATLLRLFILPAVIMLVLYAFGARENVLVYALFAFATPLGMNTVVYPAAFGGDPKTGAGMALISHTLCVVSIPIMYALFQLVMKFI